MAVQKKLDYSVEDYLAIEREAVDGKHEYVAGNVFAMTGASFRHNLINTNLVRRIGNQLEKGPCMALANDMRVRIESADACTYPDFIALCEAPSFFDNRTDTITNPALIIEILSPSTEGYDRGGKFALYRHLPSLTQYALIAQDRLSVDLYTRQDDNRWLLTAYEQPDDHIELESIGCSVRLGDLYEKVDLSAEAAGEFSAERRRQRPYEW